MTAQLLIIRGLPGSGKSTLAKNIQEQSKIPVHAVEADQFHFINGEYVYKTELASYAHEWCKSQAAYHLNQGEVVIVANTFITKRSLVPYYELAQDFGASFDFKACYGEYGSIHDVPEDVIEHMANYWEDFTYDEFIEYYNEYHNIDLGEVV